MSGETTVAFAGPSDQGKSATAAACLSHGHTLVTEDLTVTGFCDDTPTVELGHPHVRLTSETAAYLNFSRTSNEVGGDKTAIEVADQFECSSRELDIVYFLEDGAKFKTEELHTTEAVYALLQGSLSLYNATDEAEQRRHLSQCGTLASEIQVRKLTRPRSLDRLDELVQFIEADIESVTHR